MVQQVAGLALPVDEPALVEVAIDRLQDRDAASGLVHREPLGGREFERLRELGRDLSRSCLDQAGRVNALLGGVEVARVGGDEALRVSALVPPPTSIGSLERKDDPARGTRREWAVAGRITHASHFPQSATAAPTCGPSMGWAERRMKVYVRVALGLPLAAHPSALEPAAEPVPPRQRAGREPREAQLFTCDTANTRSYISATRARYLQPQPTSFEQPQLVFENRGPGEVAA
jgi:hypothetical protein